ncbi:deoxyribodipyrimidine photo-lyase, partial [Vibrio parahaemolyticus]
ESEGRRLVRHRDATLIDPDRVKTKTGGIYGMYTPFSRAVRALGDPPEPAPAPRRLPPSPPLASDTLSEWDLLPTRPDWAGG